jgi:hypothetical protein
VLEQLTRSPRTERTRDHARIARPGGTTRTAPRPPAAAARPPMRAAWICLRLCLVVFVSLTVSQTCSNLSSVGRSGCDLHAIWRDLWQTRGRARDSAAIAGSAVAPEHRATRRNRVVSARPCWLTAPIVSRKVSTARPVHPRPTAASFEAAPLTSSARSLPVQPHCRTTVCHCATAWLPTTAPDGSVTTSFRENCN